MAEFIFRARITFDGCTVFVNASTIEEARQKAREGEWSQDDVTGASMADYEITSQGEENE